MRIPWIFPARALPSPAAIRRMAIRRRRSNHPCSATYDPLPPEAFMRRVFSLAIATALFTLAGARAGDSSKHFFNGKDLTGWEGLEEYWNVKEGVLIGSHKGLSFNTFLCSKHKFTDFEMKFQVK